MQKKKLDVRFDVENINLNCEHIQHRADRSKSDIVRAALSLGLMELHLVEDYEELEQIVDENQELQL